MAFAGAVIRAAMTATIDGTLYLRAKHSVIGWRGTWARPVPFTIVSFGGDLLVGYRLAWRDHTVLRTEVVGV
jgi:hypothetical protein